MSCAPAWWIQRSPDLIIASRIGCQQSSRNHSLPPAMACEQSVCGRPPGKPQRCSALVHEEQMTGPSAIDFVVSNASFTMFSISSSVSLYAIHTRTSPPDSIHRYVLQPFAHPRRVIAFTSRRAVHVCLDRDLIDRIELTLGATFNSLCQSCCVDLSHVTECIQHHPRHQCYQYHYHHLCLKLSQRFLITTRPRFHDAPAVCCRDQA